MLFHSIFFSFICGGEISLSKISQFQHVAKFYHIEHKKKHDISIEIFFLNIVTTKILCKISPLIVEHRRPVYLF